MKPTYEELEEEAAMLRATVTRMGLEYEADRKIMTTRIRNLEVALDESKGALKHIAERAQALFAAEATLLEEKWQTVTQ